MRALLNLAGLALFAATALASVPQIEIKVSNCGLILWQGNRETDNPFTA